MKIKHLLRIAIVVGVVLLIPLWANGNVEGANWSLFDFVFAAIVLSIAGLAFTFMITRPGALTYKIAGALAVMTALFLTWVNAAVGIIGDGNPANILYLLLVVILGLGATISRFRRRGMSYTLFAVAAFQMVIPVIALLFWPLNFAPGVLYVFCLNVIFATSWTASGFLFGHNTK